MAGIIHDSENTLNALDKLPEIVSKWESAYYITIAIRNHYCNQISKQTGETPNAFSSIIKKSLPSITTTRSALVLYTMLST